MADYPSRKSPSTPTIAPHPHAAGYLATVANFLGEARQGLGNPTRPADADPSISSNASDLPSAGVEAIRARGAKRGGAVKAADDIINAK